MLLAVFCEVVAYGISILLASPLQLNYRHRRKKLQLHQATTRRCRTALDGKTRDGFYFDNLSCQKEPLPNQTFHALRLRQYSGLLADHRCLKMSFTRFMLGKPVATGKNYAQPMEG